MKTSQLCERFRRRQCTGCTRLHEPYEAQLEAKRAFVANCLHSRPELVKVPVAPTAASPMPMGYRSSVKLCLHEDSLGHKAVGLYYVGTKVVVDLGRCPAQEKSINRLVEKMMAVRGKIPARFYNHKGRSFQRGKLKFLTVRSAPESGEFGMIITHTGVPREALVGWIKAATLGRVAVYESELHPNDGDQVVGRRVSHLTGPETFKFPLGGKTFELTPGAFFQANFSLSGGLVAAATAFTGEGDVLLDLYGGFGAYTFATEKRFKKAIIVDGNDEAIAAAKRGAKSFGIEHVEAHATMCETFFEKSLTAAERKRVTHVIANPPRSGLSRKIVAELSREKLPALREIHYVSCNPDALARDLAVLVKQGFVVENVKPFDMFPQTEHVEAVARLVAAPR